MEREIPIDHIEPLLTAKELDAKGILRKTTAYRLAKAGSIPCYVVGPARTGVRFRVSEVLTALRRPVVDVLGLKHAVKTIRKGD